MGTHFNSNMLFGIILIAFALAFYIAITFNRYKTSGFKGKLPVLITSIVIGIIGIVLFVLGIVHECPNLTETAQITNQLFYLL